MNNTPLVTRVVMEIADGATIRAARQSGRELAVVRARSVDASSSMGGAGRSRGSAQANTSHRRRETAALPAPADTPIAAPLRQRDRRAAARSADIHRRRGTEAMAALSRAAVLRVRDGAPAADRPPRLRPRSRSQPAGAPAARQKPAPAATSPVLQGPQSQQIVSGGEKKYVGHPISMDFQGVDLRSVLRTFAEISGLNMVIDPDVQGTVDIVLTDVPWDQALDVILRGNSARLHGRRHHRPDRPIGRCDASRTRGRSWRRRRPTPARWRSAPTRSATPRPSRRRRS